MWGKVEDNPTHTSRGGLRVLFTGSSEHTIDSKLRLAVPAKYRNQWSKERDGEAWYCFPWPTGQLRLYTEGLFVQLAQPKDEVSRLATDADLALLKSRLFGLTERLEMDTAGRVQIPKSHADMIGLAGAGSEVAVVGAGDHLEVWDRARWSAKLKADFEGLPELTAKVQAKGLRTF